MKNLELEGFGLVELTNIELIETDGGSAPKSNWVKKLGWGYLITEVIDNWEEIKKGFSDGYDAH